MFDALTLVELESLALVLRNAWIECKQKHGPDAYMTSEMRRVYQTAFLAKMRKKV